MTIFFTVMMSSVVAYLFISNIFSDLPHGQGGILGNAVGDLLIILLGKTIGPRLILTFCFLGISIVRGFSGIEFIGYYTRQGIVLLGYFLRQKAIELVYKHILRKPVKALAKKPPPPKEIKKLLSFPELKKLSFFKIDDSKVEIFPKKPLVVDVDAKAKKTTSVAVPKVKPKYVLPDPSLINLSENKVDGYSSSELSQIATLVETVLNDFNITVEVVNKLPGPVITRFELLLAPGVKVSRITGLAKDIARGLSVSRVRVVDIIEGKPVIGLEIPNKKRELVSFGHLLLSKEFSGAVSPLTLILGKDISGQPVMADLGKMPHLLVAGTTGSGKSVAINTMILSLLFKSTPDKVRLIMIDPKMLELSVYADIPHLLTPVVTDMKEASNALRWAVGEMERRYQLMSKLGVRNLEGFNLKIEKAKVDKKPIKDPLFQPNLMTDDEQITPFLDPLPHIVIVIDELADMMMIVGKKVEELIARLAQKARAAGVHLVLATQRPSVDVLTGLIKANIPTRISFQVSSRIDSRTILDQSGAESLLGNGDMLYLPSGKNIPTRAHGAFIEDDEVHKVVNFLKSSAPPDYLTTILDESTVHIPGLDKAPKENTKSESDVLYDEAVAFVVESRKASISSVQRQLQIGYNRAARMIDMMQEAGIISEPERNGSRQVLSPPLET
ncbi:MAG: cell division protein FtsK [Methylococcales bacterium]|nr:cell division protein FtsK [Methylococcales bacterium]